MVFSLPSRWPPRPQVWQKTIKNTFFFRNPSLTLISQTIYWYSVTQQVTLFKLNSDMSLDNDMGTQQNYLTTLTMMLMLIIMMVQVMWDDVFGEPEGVRSADCAWQCSHKCFHGTRFLEYFIWKGRTIIMTLMVILVIFLLLAFLILMMLTMIMKIMVLTMIGRSCCYLSLTTIFAPCLAFCSGWLLGLAMRMQNMRNMRIMRICGICWYGLKISSTYSTYRGKKIVFLKGNRSSSHVLSGAWTVIWSRYLSKVCIKSCFWIRYFIIIIPLKKNYVIF